MPSLPSSSFTLTEAAQYAFKCQEVYPDIISFAAAIPDHLKPIFLIPVRVSFDLSLENKFEKSLGSARYKRIASRLAFMDGSTPEGDLFSYQTFLYNDITPNTVNTDPGSIFRRDDAQSQTHHQEYNFDQNIQVPTDTSYMSDVDISQYQTYPYRTVEKPIRKSSINPALVTRLALTSKEILSLQSLSDGRSNSDSAKISKEARGLNSTLLSYNKSNDQFQFRVSGGSRRSSRTRLVSVSLIDFVKTYNDFIRKKKKVDGLIDTVNVVINCDCPFWRYNGPEWNAKTNGYTFQQLKGTATEPVEAKKILPSGDTTAKEYRLCKHTYNVLNKLSDFYEQIIKNYGDNLDVLQEVLDANVDVLNSPSVVIGPEELAIPASIDDMDLSDLPRDLLEPLKRKTRGLGFLKRFTNIGRLIHDNVMKPRTRQYLSKEEILKDFKKHALPSIPDLPPALKSERLAKIWILYLKALAAAKVISLDSVKKWKNPFADDVTAAKLISIPLSRITAKKEEVFETFRKKMNKILRNVKKEKRKEMLKEEWINYLDLLLKNGAINNRQRNTWRNPFEDTADRTRGDAEE